MATAARLPIAADRVGACVRTIEFVGLDLTGVVLRMQVRLRPDTPGDPLIDLLDVTNAAAEGVRLVGVDTSGSAPISTVKIRINETTMEDNGRVPYAGEPGTPSVLSYDLIGIFGNDKRRLMFGEFVALPTTYGADNAPTVPADAPGGLGNYSAWGAATLTFDADLVRVSIDGAEIVGEMVEQAQDAAERSQEWAESAGQPGGAGSKSAKGWAISVDPSQSARLSAAMSEEAGVGENLFNPARLETNKLLANGQAVASAFQGAYVTPFIPVAPGTYITWNFAGAGADWGVQFYDLTRNYVSTPGSNLAGVPILIPAGVYYVRNSFFTASAPPSEAMFVHGQTLPASYIPYGPVSRQADRRESLINARRMRGDNLNMLQSGRVILGQYVDLNGADAALSELSTAIIPVAGLATVTVSYGLASSLGYYFRTLDGKKIGITSGPTTFGQAITVPTDAAFLYYSVNTASLTARDYSARPVFLEGTVTLPQPMGAIPATVADTRPWFGKRFILQGDSRAAEKDWPGQLAADAGIKSLRNIAVGGRGLEGALLKEGNAPLVASDFTGIDALIMMIGLNGSGFVPIGSFSDPYPAPSASGSAMPANFIPRMRYAIEQYRFWNPLMRVLCFGNMQVFGGGASYNATGEAREAERQVCELHGVPRLDLWALNGITANNYARFMPDGIHPTVEGEKVAFLQPAKGFLQSNYPMLP